MENWRKSTLKSLLEGCSWQWALENVYKLESHGSPQTALGTGFHKAMEMYELNGREDSLESLQSIAAQSAFEECKLLPMSVWFEHELDPEWVMENAKEAVRLWWEQPQNSTGKTLKELCDARKFVTAEHMLRAEWRSSMRGLSGTIDALHDAGDEYVLVDYKTASSFRKWPYKIGPTIEAAVYLWMARQTMANDKPIRFEWHIVSPKEQKVRVVDGGVYDAEKDLLLERSIVKADVLYDTQTYRPRPEWNLCSPKWCAYFQGCRGDGTLSPYALTTQNVPTGAAPSASVGIAG
jgi:hypothetical protein